MTRPPRSTQKATQQADQAADQLLDWLRQQRGAIAGQNPGGAELGEVLVADRVPVGETALPAVDRIVDEELHDKAGPNRSVSAAEIDLDPQEGGETWQGVSSTRLPQDAIETAGASADAAPSPAGGQASSVAAGSGVKGMTIPLRVQGGVSQGSTRPAEAGWNANGGVAAEGSDGPSSGHWKGCGGRALQFPFTDWLHHHLDVTGPAEVLTDFQTAARGAGTTPWPFDRDRMEEDLFHLLVAPRAPQRRRLSLAGARVLARQLCDAAELRHAAAVARVGHSRACPFDLHALVPVPAAILSLGPDHPDSLAWLRARWGTTETLRHVGLEPALVWRTPLPAGIATLRLSFWSADWTPWQALAVVVARWPALRLAVAPNYGLL